MDLDNEELEEIFSDVVQDIFHESTGAYFKKIKSEIKNLKNRINERYEKLEKIKEKINKCEKILDNLSDENVEVKILLEEWKNYLVKKKKDISPDDLIDEKGKLNAKKRQLKLLSKLSQEF